MYILVCYSCYYHSTVSLVPIYIYIFSCIYLFIYEKSLCHLQNITWYQSLTMAGQIIPSSSSSSSTIPTVSTTNHTLLIKLTPHNYLTWKTHFQPLLNYHKLSGFINGTITPPSLTISITTNNTTTKNPNPAYDEWHQKYQLLLSWIFFSLSEEAFPYVIGMFTSYDA